MVILQEGRLFKLAVFLLIFTAILGSCVTQRRCVEKFPPITTIDTIETFQIIDTTIYVHLPADTIIDSILIESEPGYVSDIALARGEYGEAKAWISDSKLRVQLTINDTLIAHRIDSLAIVNRQVITIDKEIIIEKKVTPPFYKAVLWIAIFLFVLVLCLFFLRSKR